MQEKIFRRLILMTAAATLLVVLLGGAVRAFTEFAPQLLETGYRLSALLAASLAIGTGVLGRARWAEHRAQQFSLSAITVLSFVVGLGGSSLGQLRTVAVPHPGVIMVIIAAWLVAAVYAGGERPYRSRFAMFRSQWQVPLYAALATYVVTVLGSYLKSLGAAATCSGWPLCPEVFSGQMGSVAFAHIGHRTAAALAGLLLLYTVVYVWRRHLHRPILLVLTGAAVVLFTSQVLLGQQAAESTLSQLGAFGHLVIAAALVSTLVALAVVGYYSPSLPAITGASVAMALPASLPLGEVMRAYVTLTKPRILMLLIITGYAAMWVAAGGFPSIPLTLVSMFGLAMSCGAANAINMWYDQDIDAIMKRTQKRPIPAGLLTPAQVLGFGVLTGALSFVLLAFAVNLLTAVLSLSGLLFYVLIYTMWLKRSTDQNIVIGGAAGAVPPLVGWAAVTGSLSWGAIVMFLIVFVWTPPHFWALALFRNDDYRRAGVPMLPVVRGERYTKWQILLYTLLLIPTTVGLYWTGVVGQFYLWVSLVAGLIYLAINVVLFFEKLPAYKWAVRSFAWSIFWLGFIFLAMVLDVKPL